MTNLRRLARQTLTVARRDFIATVFTPVFLLFLFAPLIMGAFGAIGGAALGFAVGEPTFYLLAGLGIGIAAALLIWWRTRG